MSQIDMPIDPDFPKNGQVIGKHMHSDGEHYHYVWGPGRTAEAADNEEVKAAYVARGEQINPVGVHGTMVAVDWDSCVADGACIEACPVNVYEWLETPGHPASEKKAFMIREKDCIFCMACENVCPPQAVKIFSKG